MNMRYSAAGVALTKSFEGLRLRAYQDSGGLWTIGYGHRGPEVRAGLVWTEAQAAAALERDLAKAIARVNGCVKRELLQNQFDALVDFAYNDGCGALEGSHLLRFVNAGQFEKAAQQFPLWDHVGGREVEGLLRRREAEAAMFRGDAPHVAREAPEAQAFDQAVLATGLV